jgi:hypothetical protein
MGAGNVHQPVEIRARLVSFGPDRRLRADEIQGRPLDGRKMELYVDSMS